MTTSDRYDRNISYLEDVAPDVLRNFNNAGDPDPDDRSTFSVKLLSSKSVDIPIQDRDYREMTRELIGRVNAGEQTVVVGLDRPSELMKIAERTGGADLLYVELDPNRFQRVLENIDLADEALDSLSIVFPDSGLDFVQEVAAWINSRERYIDLPNIVLGSRLVCTLLRGNRPVDRWFQALFTESQANLTDSMYEEMTETLETSSRDYPPAYFYRRLLNLLRMIMAGGPGIDTVESERTRLNPNQTHPPVSVVILSWNRWDLTKDCIKSVMVEHDLPEDSEVIVVDNGSEDQSPERLTEFERNHDCFKAILLDENRGPAGGREAATPHIENEFAVFLDNDSRVRADRWLADLLSPFLILDRVGAVGAFGVIHMDDEDPTQKMQKIVLPDVAVPVNWLSGFCVAMRVEALKEAGGWRPDLYQKWGSEDVAIHYALRENGWYSVVPGDFVPVDHASAHKQDHYDYDFRETYQQNLNVFRDQWGKRIRVLNLARSNATRSEETS